METGFLFAAGSALWFGILTSISPCPLASNIAAVSYIGKNVNSMVKSILAGTFYSLGRMTVYTGLSAIIVASIVSIPSLSMFLQTKINIILGPVLVLSGIVLLGLISFQGGGTSHAELAEKFARKAPLIGSFLIGFLFALAFCPVTAALFFGSMLPLSVKHQSYIIIPAAYGLGTALPVIGFAVLLATGAHYVGSVFQKLTAIEKWIRNITGSIFIIVGIYFILTFIFKIQIF